MRRGLFGAGRLTAPRTPAEPRGKAARFLTGAAVRSDVERRLRLILPMVQRRVGRNLSMRYMPRLKFEYDEGAEAGIRVGEILDGLGLGGEDGEERDGR